MSKKDPEKDRHKASKPTRIRPRLAQQLEDLAERRETDVTTEVNRAVREMLEREHLWPPPGGRVAPDDDED